MLNLTAIADLLLALIETQGHQIEIMEELLLHFDPSVYDPDALVLARAIQGEGAALFGAQRDEIAVWIAHTAYNRWEKPWWKRIDGMDCTFAARVEYDWHGTANVTDAEVEPWARRIAHRVLRERRRSGIDRANGALFAMTLDDLLTHGWQEQALEHQVRVFVAPNDQGVQFWFLDDHPEKGTGE